MGVNATIALSFELNGVGGGWTDVTQDTWGASSQITIQRGIRGSTPIDRVAATGTMKFVLNNSERNSGTAIGFYSPGHTNARGGFREGIGVRLQATYNAVTYTLFRGELDAVAPEPGRYGSKRVYCTAVDWMNEASRRTVRALDVQFDKRSDEVFLVLVAAMPKQPPAVRTEIGMDTFPLSLDSTRDEDTKVMTEFAKIALSELGAVYVTKDGTLTFESRKTRGRASTNVAIFDNSMVAMDASRSRGNLVNRVLAVARPRKVGTSTTDVLYSLSTNPAIGPNDTKTFFGPYLHPVSRERIAGMDFQALVAGTDYVLNSAEDGSGTNLTSQFVVSVSAKGNGAYFTVTNNSQQTGFIRTLQLRGRTIAFESVVSEAKDDAAIFDYGSNDMTLQMPYQADPTVSDSAARYFLGLAKDPLTGIERFTFLANDSDTLMQQAMLREISDRIGIVEYVTGVSTAATGSATGTRGFFINAIDMEIRQGGRIRVSYVLTPADQNAYWILGQPGASELNQTTRLSYGLFAGHIDTPHIDSVHSDVAHVDTAHVDVAHGDAAHGDAGHSDVAHVDVVHVDSAHSDAAHSDTPHTDSSSHSDTAHQDVTHDDVAHVDTAHSDVEHNDTAHGDSITHTDHDDHIHVDMNSHGDVAHADDAHGDAAHVDSAHSDTAHQDLAHADSSTHNDVAHVDGAHGDTAHGDSAHSDTAHSDSSHSDSGHVDSAHSDTAHADTPHTDVVHGDVGHGDTIA
jgi:hypothetical protein